PAISSLSLHDALPICGGRSGAAKTRGTRRGALRRGVMPRRVTAFSNTTVKRLRSLRDKKARRLEGLFLAEGLRILAEARDSGRLDRKSTRLNSSHSQI